MCFFTVVHRLSGHQICSRRSFARLIRLPCSIKVSVHKESKRVFLRLEQVMEEAKSQPALRGLESFCLTGWEQAFSGTVMVE